MLRFIKRYGRYLAFVFLALLPFVFLFVGSRSGHSRNIVIAPVIDLAGGLERVMLKTTGGLSDFFQKYLINKDSFDDLTDLRRQFYANKALEAKIRELEFENLELRKVVNAPKIIRGVRQLTARVVGRSGSPLTRTLRLNRGSQDDIRVGDGVISAGQIVGRVLKVGYFHCDVMLLSSPSSAFDVVVQRSRERAVLLGSPSEDYYRMKIGDFDHNVDVQVGDFILSSGLHEFFPPGLFVGTVEEVKISLERENATIIVKPAVDLKHVEWVQVLIRSRGDWPVLLKDVAIFKSTALDSLKKSYELEASLQAEEQ